MKSKIATVFVMLLCLFCCKHNSRYDSSPKIVGGKDVEYGSIAYTSNVALIKNDTGKAFCSGTLIAKNLIVTASHCLDAESTSTFKVLFGKSDRDPDAIKIEVDQFASRRENFAKYFPNFDISWVKLKSNAPKPYEPVEIFHNGRNPDFIDGDKLKFLLAGYGKQSTNCANDSCRGIRKEVYTLLKKPLLSNSRLFSLLVFGPRQNFGACNGDSGGPAYFKAKSGKWYLVGATNGASSFLTPAVFEGEVTGCEAGQDVYTFVGDYVDWIEKSSGIKLPYNPNLNPRQRPIAMDDKSKPQKNWTFRDWYSYNNNEDARWYTVSKMIETVLENVKDFQEQEELFLDPEAIQKNLESSDKIVFTGAQIDFQRFKITDRALEDITPFTSINFKGLEFKYNVIKDYSPLAQIDSLEYLNITLNKSLALEDIPINLGFLGEMKNLKELELNDIALMKDHQQMIKLEKVESLRLTRLRNFDLGLFTLMPKLKILTITASDIGNLSKISHYPNLEKLVLDGVSAELVSQLSGLTLPKIVQVKLTPEEKAKLPQEILSNKIVNISVIN